MKPESASQLQRLLGERFHTDLFTRKLHATDASEYQELPMAVAFPGSEGEVAELVRFADKTGTPLIPRTAGTSLAGQVVGSGIVVDCGRHLHRIVSLDVAARRVVVQPGVVRNELNHFLHGHGLLFGPETSTANRAMIGGMVGNNSCGSNSLVYGSTREHLISARGFLSDGSEVVLGSLDRVEFEKNANPEPIRWSGEFIGRFRTCFPIQRIADSLRRIFRSGTFRDETRATRLTC